MALRPQQLAGLGLLALLPVASFVVFRNELVVVLSLLNVLVIVASVYYMFSPASGIHDHDRDGDHGEPAA